MRVNDSSKMLAIRKAREKITREEGLGESLFPYTGLFDLADPGAENFHTLDLIYDCRCDVRAWSAFAGKPLGVVSRLELLALRA